MKKEDKKVTKLLKAHSEEKLLKAHSEETNKAQENKDFPGYPHYPASEDIYSTEEKVDLNPDDLSENEKSDTKPGKRNEKSFREDKLGEDLDVPGSEADDAQENIGSEDEENNYYSIGGDNHNDLEEDNG